jgi:CDGSH-type Zn-finger protein
MRLTEKRNIAMATIKVLQNGPYVVHGDDVSAVDWKGAEYQVSKRPFALCRCGASMAKPFCDGMHTRIGFKADGTEIQEKAGSQRDGSSRQAVSDPINFLDLSG